mgnify:CR=1 FL=1
MNKWLIVLFVLIGLYVVGIIFAFFAFNSEETSFGNKIVVYPLEGVISSSSSGGFFDQGGIYSTDVVNDIEVLDADDSVNGVVFEINSPGGTVVPSQEIADAIKKNSRQILAASGRTPP